MTASVTFLDELTRAAALGRNGGKFKRKKYYKGIALQKRV